MNYKIDSFYHDKKLGSLKYKGMLEGNHIFDNHMRALGQMNTQRVTLSPVAHKNRLGRLKPIPPPE